MKKIAKSNYPNCTGCGKRTTQRLSETRFKCEECYHKQASAMMTEQTTGEKTGWENMPTGIVDISE